MAPDPSTSPPQTPDGIEWEKQKWTAEHELKVRELRLKEDEQRRSRLSNPLVVAIFAAAVAGVFNACVTLLNGLQERGLEEAKAKDAQHVEEMRSEANRILEMIKTADQESATKNLRFLIDTGLITDKERVQQIEEFVQKRGAPVLPAAGERYTVKKSDALTSTYLPELQKSLDAYIAYLDQLGFEKRSGVEIHVLSKTQNGGVSYYVPGEDVIEMLEAVATDEDTPRREYTHHVLLSGSAVTDGANRYGMEGGLTIYLPSSFGDHAIHSKTAKAIVGVMDLRKPVSFKAIKSDDYADMPAVKMSWASLLWQARDKLTREVMDPIVAKAWLHLKPMSDKYSDSSIAAAFDRQLLDEAASVSANAAQEIRSLMLERHFPL